jgi:homoserine dehydrogenase
MRQIKIGLLGCGTVGRGFVDLLERNRSLIAERASADVVIHKILVRDLAKSRPGIDASRLTTHAEDVIENGSDIIVELIGGTDPARRLIRESLIQRKHVVTANKAVLSHAGGDLLDLAAAHGVQLRFEASVCGAIPIVRVLRQSLVGNRVTALRGIVNGTCNFILTRMSEDGLAFDDALRLAQARGFAEADPTLDIDGEDAEQKLTILAQLALGNRETRWVRREGIRDVTPSDVKRAAASGVVIRLVATATDRGDHVDLSVGPEQLHARDPLASARDEVNSLAVQTDAGELLFYGRGAGSLPSASSVLADVVDIAGAWNVTRSHFAHTGART